MSARDPRTLALLAALLLPGPAAAQGFAGLSGPAAGFAPVTSPAALAFPRDHARHPDFRIEWWYLTADLAGPDGAAYGVQWTLFRTAIAPGTDAPGWANGQLWMAHAAATAAGLHRFAETFARGGVGHPHLRTLPARSIHRRHRLAEERPLNAVRGAVGAGEVGGQVPPLDAEVGMGAMVARKGERGGRRHCGEALGVGAEPGKALGLREGWDCQGEAQRTDEGAAISAHC